MGRREREEAAARAAERVAADVGGTLSEVCGEDAPAALVATVGARALVAARLRDYQAAERAAAAAAEAVAAAIDASAAACERAALAEIALQDAYALYGRANDELRAARDAGALGSYVPPAHRGDAWEPPADEVNDGSEEDPGRAEQRGAGAVR